jgi:hypothetical protein
VALLTTGMGIALGEIWATLGLPALQLGDANLLPGVLFAILMQPLADRTPTRAIRWPR